MLHRKLPESNALYSGKLVELVMVIFLVLSPSMSRERWAVWRATMNIEEQCWDHLQRDVVHFWDEPVSATTTLAAAMSV